MRRRMAGSLEIRFQAPKRVGPPLKNQGSSVDSLQAIGYYKIMKKKVIRSKDPFINELERIFKNAKKRSKKNNRRPKRSR